MYNEQETPESAQSMDSATVGNALPVEYILEPPISKFQEKYYSLEPDMANGWRPNRKGYRQFPLRFTYQPADSVVSEYTKFGQERPYRVLYLGPRHSSNLKAIKNYCWKEYEPGVRESFLYDSVKLSKYEFPYGKQKEKASIYRTIEHRIFTGMNPTVDSEQLLFDSDFECGNLDVVMKVAPREYDLFMRVDSNTRGHNSWYFFRIKNTRAESVLLNICNFHKPNSLYTTGLRPYCFSKLASKEWKQLPNCVEYARKNLRYEGQVRRNLFCLTFQYRFEVPYDEVYFAYSVPYSYSYLLSTLKALASQHSPKGILNISYNYESSCGLSIPLVTLTNADESSTSKRTVLLTARQHPGQTQGSWMMHGLLQYLCSEEARELRSQVVFKVLPMVNVDGVVLGNFRTGAMGLDLNRLFLEEETDEYYEVEYIKELASAKSNLMYLDFHGHSTKKSVFIYGPDYKLSDTEYIPARLLPKQISRLTDIFRYYSCSFKISKGKESTARASLLREFQIPYVYTVEASTHCYTSHQGELRFTSSLYTSVGWHIGSSLSLTVPILIGVQSKKSAIKQHLLRIKQKKLQRTETVSLPRMSKKGRSMSNKKTSLGMKLDEEEDILNTHSDLLEEIRQEDKEMFDNNSEGESDCQDANEDYSKAERAKYFEKSDLAKPSKKGKHTTSPYIRARQRKSELAQVNFRRRLNDSEISQEPSTSMLPRERLIQLEKSLASPDNSPPKKLQGNNRKSKSRAVAASEMRQEGDADGNHKERQERRRRQLERVYNQSQRIMDNQQIAKVTNLNLQQGLPGENLPETLDIGKRKMSTIESRRSEPDGLEQYNTCTKIIPKHGILNMPLALGDDLLDAASRKHKSLCYQRLPDITRKDVRKRKVEVVNCDAQIPEVISCILRKHMRLLRQGVQERHLNKSIQIIKL